jgi:hypothetical protein
MWIAWRAFGYAFIAFMIGDCNLITAVRRLNSAMASIDAISLWQNREGTIRNMKNFHVPLPDETYDRLRTEAASSRVPATAIAREAIDFWLRQQLRKTRHEAIAAYAAETAGTALDLDPDLEAAGIDHLINTRKKST